MRLQCSRGGRIGPGRDGKTEYDLHPPNGSRARRPIDYTRLKTATGPSKGPRLLSAEGPASRSEPAHAASVRMSDGQANVVRSGP